MKKLFFLLCFMCRITFSECYDNPIRDTIYDDLNVYVNGSKLSLGNIFWPSCDEIEKKLVKDQNLLKGSAPLECWIGKYLVKFAANELLYLTEMEKGDDWITGWHTNKNLYIQYIDGRLLTILIRFGNGDVFNFHKDSIFQILYAKLNKIVKFQTLSLNENSNIFIQDSNANYLEGYFYNTYNNLSDYKKDYIWTNGEYIVLIINKIAYPYRSIKGKLYNSAYIINSIPFSDKRSFKRFKEDGNIDFNEEMFKTFPWMQDSIQFYKRFNENEIYGRTPVYMIDKKK